MSFRDTHSRAHNARVFIAVAAIHAIAIYGLANGFAGAIVRLVVDRPMDTHDVKPDVTVRLPDPPRPRVPGQPHGEASGPTVTTVPTGPFVTTTEGPSFPPLEFPFGDGGLARPPEPAPTFTPRAASPLGRPGTWASTDDYPVADLRAEHEGITRFSLAITADGAVSACTVTATSGWPGLDAATCRLVTARARFQPATDSTGARVPGHYASAIRWVIPR